MWSQLDYKSLNFSHSVKSMFSCYSLLRYARFNARYTVSFCMKSLSSFSSPSSISSFYPYAL